MTKTASTLMLDAQHIEKLRKDLLTLLKNIPRVKTYRDGSKLYEAVKIFRIHFDEFMFEQFLNRDFQYKYPELDVDREYLRGKLRKLGWDLHVELTLPLAGVDEYMSEEQALERFKVNAPKWANRVKTKARTFWNALNEVLEVYTQRSSKPGFDVDVHKDERINMDGFDVLVVGYGDDNDIGGTEDLMARFRAGLKHFKARASATLPVMLKAMLPIHLIAYLHKLDEGGRYRGRYIEIALHGSAMKHPGGFAHLLAHEMGHHLYASYLSSKDREFWSAAIGGNYGPFDIEKALKLWPGDAWAYDMPQHLKDIDPTLAIQIQLIGGGYTNGPSPQTKEDFEKLHQSGVKFLVPQNPITGYSGKNYEEAFCEAVGMLVAYGTQAVDPLVRSWLKLILPGIKTAAEQFNESKVKDLLKDSEVMLENYNRANDPEAFAELQEASRQWLRHHQGTYSAVMRYLRQHAEYHSKDPDRQMEIWRKQLWPLFKLESAMVPPTYEAWLRVRGELKRDLKEVVDGLPGVITFLNKLRKTKKVVPEVPRKTTTNLSIDGFDMILHGYDEDNAKHRELVEMLGHGLKEYTRHAKRYFPILLKKKLPMDVRFDDTSSSGNYGNGRIDLKPASFKDAHRFMYTIAHETGHYIGMDWMSHAARAFWISTIKGDVKDIDLREFIKDMQPGWTWYNLSNHLKETDPVKYLQFQAVLDGFAKVPKALVDADDWTKEGLERYLANGGDPIIKVMQTPITSYANANPDEAFAEAVAMLVAYGPQAVHPKVKQWLSIVLPGVTRTAAHRVAVRFRLA